MTVWCEFHQMEHDKWSECDDVDAEREAHGNRIVLDGTIALGIRHNRYEAAKELVNLLHDWGIKHGAVDFNAADLVNIPNTNINQSKED